MSNTDKSKTVGWVYYLNKSKVIEELQSRDIDFDEGSNLDVLRKLLAGVIKTENQEPKVQAADDQESKVQATDNTENENQGNSSSEESFASLHTAENSDSDVEMDRDSSRFEFNLDKGDWEIFTERLEIYFTAKDISAEKKNAVLLQRLDEDAYKLIRSLCSPTKPITKSYDDLKKIMSDHLRSSRKMQVQPS